MQKTDLSFEILEDSFPLLTKKQIKEYENHCVTYLIHNDSKIYIGETSHLRRRFDDHKQSKQQYNLKASKIIISKYFNKSAVYDLETKLINYIFADGKYEILNIKTNQSSHQYYMKEEINNSLFKSIWGELEKKKFVKHNLNFLENSSLFKYSPFKEFSIEQQEVITLVLSQISFATEERLIAFDGQAIFKRAFKENRQQIIIEGGPGTGKSLLIIKIIYDLLKKYEVESPSIAVCIPQSSLLSIFKTMLKRAKLKVDVIRPIDLSKNQSKIYDLLIVDEAHRLKQHFSKQTKDLKHLEKGKFTELDFATKKSRHLILMYDENQTVRPADVSPKMFHFPNALTCKLTEQFRVKKGKNYLKFIESLLQIDNATPEPGMLGEYQLKLYDDLNDMYEAIKKHDQDPNVGLARMGSGYYKEWVSKKNPLHLDFEDEGLKLKWNSTLSGWANTPNAINEIGCIHTLQGIDLNYAGIIIGDDLYFDKTDNKVKINKQNYHDRNGTPVNGTDINDVELTKYIKNIYYVLLTRGILGTFIFIKDNSLRDYFKKYITNKP